MPITPTLNYSHLNKIATLIFIASLSACGGGGGDDLNVNEPAPAPLPAPVSSPAPDPGTTPPPAPAPAPAPAPGVVVGNRATCQLSNFEAEALQKINALRLQGATCGTRGAFAPTNPLVFNTQLNQAALVHSDDMVLNNFFSHTGSNGSSAGTRITASGYTFRTWGENIAAGQASVSSVMDAWRNSDGHCANLMNPNFNDIGLACVSGGSGNPYPTYWTMTLGAQR